MKNFDFDAINNMSFEQKKQQLPKLARTANKRLSALEKKGYTKNAYEKTMNRLGREDRKRFYTGSKYENRYAIQHQLHMLEDFLQSITSTPTGYKQLKKKRIEIFQKKFDEYNATHEKKLILDDSNIDDFYDFLSSEQFRSLGQRVDSNQVIEDFVDYIARYDIDTVLNEFDNYLHNNINTFEQVGERLQATHGKRLK